MNSGSFFRLDLETSKVAEGITFFNYLDAPDFGDGFDCLRYPIRVAISSESVSFFIHYFDDYKTGLANDVERKEELMRPHHAEETILLLPYGSANPEELSSSIKRVYNTTFPIGSSYLKGLIENRYVRKYEDDNNRLLKCEREYKRLQKSKVNKDSYSSLFIWGLLSSDDRIIVSSESNCTISKFLRKLLLDFMFDLMHSDVFESSKYYSQMREGLMNDFFFSSIVKKCEFYYYRRLIRSRFDKIEGSRDEKIQDLISKIVRKKDSEVIQDSEKIKDLISKIVGKKDSEILTELVDLKGELEGKLREKKEKGEDRITISELEELLGLVGELEGKLSIKNLYAEHLWYAEKAWVNTIMSPMAERHFAFTPDWYENQETREKHRQQKQFIPSDSWFVDPEEEMERVLFPLEKKREKEKYHYLNSFELSNLIGSKDNTSVLKQNTTISKWFYNRFDFSDAFRMHIFNFWNVAFVVFLALICGLVLAIPEFLACPLNLALYFAVVGGAGLITAAKICSESKKIKKESLDHFLIFIRRKREAIRALRLALFFCATALCLWLSNSYSVMSIFVWLILCVVILLWDKLFIARHKIHLVDNVHLVLPRLVASITTAWIMLVIGNDIIKENFAWPLWIVITIIVFFFILYENNKKIHNTTTGQKIWRAIELVIISYSISLVIGIFAIDILSVSLPDGLRPYMWAIKEGDPNLSVFIYPQFLTQFSFLAMFIGVFIQMIFEEKSITEL